MESEQTQLKPPTSLGGLLNGDQKSSEAPLLPPIHAGQQQQSTKNNGPPPNKSPFESGFNNEDASAVKPSSKLLKIWKLE